MPHMLIFGLGYTASALAQALKEQGGWGITATRRPPLGQAPVGITLLPFDGQGPIGEDAFKGVSHLLVSIPPGAEGDRVLRHHRASLASMPDLEWVGYLSTTGVYGHSDNAWVNEASPTAPTQARSVRRAQAEADWQALAAEHGLPLHIFRLAGIYGPGRNPLLRVKEGRARRIDLPGHLSSRIHVEDITQVLLASVARPNPGAIYNLADDEPAPPEAVTALACELLGLIPPPLLPLDQAGLSPMALSFYQDRRRVDNRRIKDELGISLAYPTYREGLRALARGV